MAGRSVPLGAGPDGVSEDSDAWAEVLRIVYVEISKHRAFAGFTFSSAQVNVDTVFQLHRDDCCVGVSLILVGGDFSGGEFLLPEGGSIGLKNAALLFDGLHNDQCVIC